MSDLWPNHIAYWRKKAGMSQDELAAAIDPPTTKGTISLYESGKRKPSQTRLSDLAEALGCSAGDLLDGPGISPPPLPEGAIPVIAIPVVGEISAGNWKEAVQRSSMVIPAPLPSMPPRAFALEVSGDSMDLLVEDGAMIIVDPGDTTFFHKRYYAVLNEDGETTFKQYLGEPPRLVPCSSNPAHKEIPLGGQPVTVIGRIIWRSARM